MGRREMEIQEIKTFFPNQLPQSYKNDIQKLMNLLLELDLSSYPVQVKIFKYIDADEISYIEVEFIKDVATLDYSFGEKQEFQSARLYKRTTLETMYTTADRMDGESEEMYEMRCEDEGTYTFQDVLKKTKEVATHFKGFIDSLE